MKSKTLDALRNRTFSETIIVDRRSEERDREREREREREFILNNHGVNVEPFLSARVHALSIC